MVAFSGPGNQDEPRFLLWRRGRAEAGERCEASRQQHLTTGPSPIFEDGKNNYVREDMAQVRHAPPLQFPACSAFACTFQGPYTAHTSLWGGCNRALDAPPHFMLPSNHITQPILHRPQLLGERQAGDEGFSSFTLPTPGSSFTPLRLDFRPVGCPKLRESCGKGVQ